MAGAVVDMMWGLEMFHFLARDLRMPS